MISIIDYQSGNLGAIVNMLKKIGAEARIISKPAELEGATKIILPGVGTFDTGIQNLRAGGWEGQLEKKVLVDNVPTLGICLGMQLMTGGSEEGKLEGLKWIDGFTHRFQFSNREALKVPHMGWNEATSQKESKILRSLNDQSKRFYFAHAYYVRLADPGDELLSTTYGFPFSSGFERGNIMGLQFHPEKSHRFGLAVLKNFAENS